MATARPDPSAAPSPAASPEAAAAPVATATPAATPSATATAAPSPTPTPTPAPTPPPTATPLAAPATPTAPAVPAAEVTGPLLVLSERVSAEEAPDGRELEVRRIAIRDLGTGRYWTAFGYTNARYWRFGALGRNHSAVQPAAAGLIVWSDDRIRGVGLDGEREAILLDHPHIRQIAASPDGTRVAVNWTRTPCRRWSRCSTARTPISAGTSSAR